MSSPLRRTLYTTLLGFEPEVKQGFKIIALPELQETGDLPCDRGSDVDLLQKEMDGKPVDLSLVHGEWNSKQGKWAPDHRSVELRARQVRQWLRARPEKEIVVVTHGGFLHYLTDDWSGTKVQGMSLQQQTRIGIHLTDLRYSRYWMDKYRIPFVQVLHGVR